MPVEVIIVFCPECGRPITDQSKFCKWCGIAIGSGDPVIMATIPSTQAPPPPAKLPSEESATGVGRASGSQFAERDYLTLFFEAKGLHLDFAISSPAYISIRNNRTPFSPSDVISFFSKLGPITVPSAPPDNSKFCLSGADLFGWMICDPRDGRTPFVGSILDACKAERSVWLGVSLRLAHFAGADLREAHLYNVNLEGTDFQNADLRGAFLTPLVGPHGPPPNFTGANLSGATFYLSSSTNIVLADAVFDRITLDLSVISNDAAKLKEVESHFLAQVGEAKRESVSVRVQQEPKSQCFIATAACGGESAGEVESLRTIRDQRLSQSRYGRAFIKFYELWSPSIAERISASPLARFGIRVLVIRPAAALARKLERGNSDNT
ncbi:MAG: CFI-box-CTERM domain-containing protein [Bryobacteraceae bacterium]